MKLSRRMFFGTAAGAAAAGPSIAGQLADQLNRNAIGTVTSQYVDEAGSAAKMVAKGEWRVSRISQLKRIISGEEDEHEVLQRQYLVREYLDQIDRYQLDGLKSVSMSHKVRMLAESAASRAKRQRIMEAEWELNRMENEPFNLGGLLG